MNLKDKKQPVVLSIAGFDPTSGAGVIADIKTFAAFNCYGLAVTTAITVQDTTKVHSSIALSADLVTKQLNALSKDIAFDVVKIGMLANNEIVLAIIDFLVSQKPKFVIIDPLIYSTSGYPLLEETAKELVINKLFPLATLITPNLMEASILLNERILELEAMKQAATKLNLISKTAVLIKGGHLSGDPIDLFYNGKDYKIFSSPRIKKTAHGTGCALSSAISAALACGNDLIKSIEIAKDFMNNYLITEQRLGQGNNLLNHFSSFY